MRASQLQGSRTVAIIDVPRPELYEPTDAIVRVSAACVCGSDLWSYRAADPEPALMGHELIGVVEEVGHDVRTVTPGDFVVAPFVFSDGDCAFCRDDWPTSCVQGGIYGYPDTHGHPVDGGQGEYVRVPLADGTLVATPENPDDALIPALATLSDVAGTGHHAAVSGGVGPGSTVAVVGDGAVGLCAVLAAVRLGAERVIALSSHPDRAAIATRFGATDIVSVRGEAARDAVRDLVGELGVPHVLECVGTDQSWSTAFDLVGTGGSIGYVGVPAGITEGFPIRRAYGKNVHLAGGVAPVRRYLPALMEAVLDGTFDPSPVLTHTLPLTDIAEAYAAMDERRAVKVLIRP